MRKPARVALPGDRSSPVPPKAASPSPPPEAARDPASAGAYARSGHPVSGPAAGRTSPKPEQESFAVEETVFDAMPEPSTSDIRSATEGVRKRSGSDDPQGPDLERARILGTALRKSARRKREDAGPKKDYVATAETQAAYMARGRSLVVRYLRETGGHIPIEDVDPLEFVNWFLSIKPTVVPNTWRLYRTSTLSYIQTMPHHHLDEASALLEADIGIGHDGGRSEYSGRRSANAGATSADKAKRIDKADFHKVVSQARLLSRSVAVPWLLDWMHATIHTGLRPSEWAIALLEIRPAPERPSGRRAWLHVVNAKSTFGRSHGAYRTLDISDYSDESFEAIERMVRRAAEWAIAGEFGYRQRQVAQLFYEITNILFPRRVYRLTLYTLRHQFIANMKTVHNRADLAALIGHVSIETQVEHYGKKRSAWLPHEITEIPSPVEDQVVGIRRRLELLAARVESSEARAKTKRDGGAESRPSAPPTGESSPDRT